MRGRLVILLLPLLLLLFVLSGYVLYPLAVTFIESLRFEGGHSLDRYIALFDPANRASWEAIWNSVFVSALTVVFSCMIGTLFAVVFTQFEFPLSNLLARVAVMPIALPPLVGVVAFLFVFGESGIIPRGIQTLLSTGTVPFFLEGLNAIVAVHVYSFSVYYYLFVSTALRRLDASLIEAASGLGSSTWPTFRRVILPGIRPAIIGASILTFMASMASFSAPFLFGGDRRFMTTQIYSSKLNGDFELAAAQALGLAAVSVVFFVALKLFAPREADFRVLKGADRPRPIPVRRGSRVVLIGTSIAILFVEILPILTIVLISFVQEGSWTWQILPTSYTVDNYVKLLNDPRVFEPVRNSLLMSLLAVGLALVVGTIAAYTVVKGGLRKTRVFLDLLVTLPFALPGTVVALGLILAFSSPSIFSAWTVLVGTFWILPLAYFVRTFPLVVRSTSAALERFDDSLMEAAQTFGAGVLRRFRKIALPLILPGIVSGALLVMIAGLGEFVSSILLYTYASRPISIEILSQLRSYNFGGAAAYCSILLVIILLVVLLSGVFAGGSRSRARDFIF
jgi:iron(III) transport system permease protein